jgi:hypothetical protein
VIEDEVGLEASCLYVLENPVRAGLCEKPTDWHWSGCPALEAPSRDWNRSHNDQPSTRQMIIEQASWSRAR